MSTAKILVVDDDKNLLEFARTRLKAASYQVTTALCLPGNAPDHWGNVLTGEHLDPSVVSEKKVLPLRSVFRDFPVALLSQPQASNEPNVVGKRCRREGMSTFQGDRRCIAL
jgi:maltooligosyltrehalose synthase